MYMYNVFSLSYLGPGKEKENAMEPMLLLYIITASISHFNNVKKTNKMFCSPQGNTIYVKGFGLTEQILQESFTKFGEFIDGVHHERVCFFC